MTQEEYKISLKELSIEALKARAYDALAQKETCEITLRVINQELFERNKPETK